MTFYGREQQKKSIHKLFQSDVMKVLLLYGRRRVGKSELIKQCLRETSTAYIYYECKQTTELNNVDSLATLIAEKFNYPRLSFTGMEEILDFLFQRGSQEKLILVLDEYPYVRNTVKGMDSILQSLIDKYRDSSALKLIICGSFVDTMKSLLLDENPLYGRIDLTINLKPMDYYESAMFYPSFSDEDKARLYSVFGGIPYYNRLIDPALSVRENITELIASPGARLENEVTMYLRSEISKIANANEVFEALAKGYSKYNDILSQSHVTSAPTMIDVLDRLIRMEVVSKQSPINEENNKRKSGYYIIDNLSRFFYRYVFRFSSQLSVMNPDLFYEHYIEKDFHEKYVPLAFEEICRQYLIRQNRLGLLPEPFMKIGKYYYDIPSENRNGEFDLVTEDQNGYIFYEVKFRKEPLTQAIIRKEIDQVKATNLNCYKYAFISRSDFHMEPEENMIFISLHELYQ